MTVAVENLLIDGERVVAAEGRTFDTVNPANGEVFRTVAEAGAEDADRAVRAAARAFEEWGSRNPVQRAKVLYRWADLIEEHADELALIETRDMGMAIGDARWCAGNAAAVMRYYAGAVDKFFGATIPVDRDGIVLTFREPIGVTALITPWNFPLNIGNWKTAPAIAAGNTVVLKPASLSPLSALRYAELGLEAGLPAGVLNVVPGPGRAVGDALVDHPLVGKVGFTGSTEVGIEIARKAAGTVKRVTLELGGKSACIVFADADLEKAGRLAPFAVFENAGQDCCARSRLLVEASAKDELLEHYAAATRGIVVGDPESTETQMGPLVSAAQRETVEGYIGRGVDEGATVLEGGARPDEPCPRERLLPPPHDPRRLHERHGRRARGDLRAGGLRDHLRDRGRGDPARERHAVRPLRIALDARRRAPAPGRARAPDGRDRGQLEQLRLPAGALRRLQGVRGRARSSGWRGSSTTPS